MGTRANVLIKDGYGDKLFFYRHSDGYPEGTMPTLEKFLGWLKAGKIRNNVGQCAGWLIMLGNEEYREYGSGSEPSNESYGGWKVGAYEPTTCIHNDVQYVYTIDLEKETIKVKEQ